MLGGNFKTVRENKEIFIKANKDIGLQVNSEKSKYMDHILPTKCSIKSKYSNWKFIFWKCGNIQRSGCNKIQVTFASKLNTENTWEIDVVILLRQYVFLPILQNWKLMHIKQLYYQLYCKVVKFGLSLWERNKRFRCLRIKCLER